MSNYEEILNTNTAAPKDSKADFAAESKANRTRCYELLEQMTEEVAGSGKNLQRYLDVQSRFDRYTPSNALLIMGQREEARKLGNYGFWREQGVFIKRQERNNYILILEPGDEYQREDGSIGTYYNAKKLYDVSQTTMRNKIEPQVSMDEKLLVRALINRSPVALQTVEAKEMKGKGGAEFSPEESCIYIKKGMSGQEIFRSVSKELAHAELSGGATDYNRDTNELRAAGAAYLLCKKYGIDTKGMEFTHDPKYFGEMELQEIRGELSKIRDTAGGISQRMHKFLEQERGSQEKGNER